jgi:adenylate cyclase
MVRPFGHNSLMENACPMSDILSELQSQLSELQAFKDEAASQFSSA